MARISAFKSRANFAAPAATLVVLIVSTLHCVADQSISRYIRIVQQEYQSLPDLDGWWTTSDAVKRILDQQGNQLETTTIHDVSNQELLQKIHDIVCPAGESIVYLAGHVDKSGLFLDRTGQSLQLSDLLKELTTHLKPSVILVDTCYASTGLSSAIDSGIFAIYASGNDEPTYALDLVKKAPVDLKKRYPEAWNFASGPQRKKQNTISYLGFSMILGWTGNDVDLSRKSGWESLGRALVSAPEKDIFQQRGLASTISVSPRGN